MTKGISALLPSKLAGFGKVVQSLPGSDIK